MLVVFTIVIIAQSQSAILSATNTKKFPSLTGPSAKDWTRYSAPLSARTIGPLTPHTDKDDLPS